MILVASLRLWKQKEDTEELKMTQTNEVAIETKLKKEAANITMRVNALEIKDQSTYDSAAALLKAVVVLKRDIVAYHKPGIEQAKMLLSTLKTRQGEMTDPLDEAEVTLRRKTAIYDEQMEKERRRLEAEEAVKAQKAEEDRRLAEAEALESSGQKDAATEVLNTPVIVPRPVVQNHQRAEGLSTRTVWKYEITNPNLIPREYLKVDDVKIGQVVRASSGSIAIPGVKVWSEKSTSVRV
jgi:hypothetical protein